MNDGVVQKKTVFLLNERFFITNFEKTIVYFIERTIFRTHIINYFERLKT